MSIRYLPLLPPHHLVHYANVTLNDSHDFGGDVFVGVVRDGKAGMAVSDEGDGGVNGLEKAHRVDAGEHEAAFIQSLRAFGAGADADGGERVADGGEEAALLREGAGVADHGKGVHLKAIVVVEAEWLVLNDPAVKLEAGGCQAVAAARMAAVEDRHVVLLGHAVDGSEKAQEVLLCVDILLAVGAQEDVFAFFKAKPLVDVAGLDFSEVIMQDFRHRAARDVGSLFRKAAVGKVAASMFAVGHVHVAYDVHDAAVGLFRKAFVLTAVARLHMEDGDMQALGPDDAKATVGISQHKHGIRFGGHHKLI